MHRNLQSAQRQSRCTVALKLVLVLVATWAIFALSARAENLLVNPGFDDVDAGGMPKRWDLYVMPMDGAEGTLDRNSFEGSYAAMLRNPQIYASEPSNNWSQAIIEDLGGKELIASANIRTEDATEAAIWLQCWKKNPPRVLAAVSSSTDSPVYGTQDWIFVETKVRAPRDTDFVVLRCVLQGRGTAWFDSLSLSEVEVTENGTGAADSEDDEEKAGDGPDDRAAREIIAAKEEMETSIEELKETNASLRTMLREIQEELSALRGTLDALSPTPSNTIPRPDGSSEEGISPRAVEGEPPLARRGHPLVPHVPTQGAPRQ